MNNQNFRNRLIDCLSKYRNLGEVVLPNGTTSIGKIPGKEKWFLIHLFGGLNLKEIQEMEEAIDRPFPESLKMFLRTMNGTALFGAGQLSLWGKINPVRQDMPNYQPISLVNAQLDELATMTNLPPDAIVIG